MHFHFSRFTFLILLFGHQVCSAQSELKQDGSFPQKDYLANQGSSDAGSAAANQDDDVSTGRVTNGKLYLPKCFVVFIDEIQVPAREAGAIVELNFREGDQFQAGQTLAKVDTRLFELSADKARRQFELAKEKALDETSILAGAKEQVLQKTKYNRSVTLRDKGSLPQAELEIAQFEFELAVLKQKKATFEQQMAIGEATVAEAAVKEIEARIERSKIAVDFDGEVIESIKHKLEWANAGDPVLRVARFDRLGVQATVDATAVDSHQIRRGQNVTVTLKMAGGNSHEFQGKITNVSQVRETGTLFKIKAEIDNRKQNNSSWLLQTNAVVSMVVDLAQ